MCYRSDTEPQDSLTHYEDLFGLSCENLPFPLHQQFNILSCLSNFHWGTYPCTRTNEPSSLQNSVGFQHFLSFQDPKENTTSTDFHPTSHRNRFTYFTVLNRLRDNRNLLNFIFQHHSHLPRTYASRTEPQSLHRRKTNPTEQLPSSETCAQNMTLVRETPYDHVKVSILENGDFFWHHHTDDLDIVIFNDYNTDGELLLSTYVHTSVDWSHGHLYDCSCSAFATKQSMHVATSDSKNGCFHTRFLSEVTNRLNDETPLTSRPIDVKIKSTLQLFHGKDILRLPHQKPSLTKLSVFCKEQCAIVHVQASGLLVCMDGMCRATLRNRRLWKNIQNQTSTTLCPHMMVMKDNADMWVDVLEDNDMLTDPEPQESTAELNIDDEDIMIVSIIHVEFFNYQSFNSSIT